MAEQRIGLGRFLAEHVERRAGYPSFVERRAQRDLVNQAAAGAIYDPHARLHHGDRVGADDVAGPIGERSVQRDEVGAPEQIGEFDPLDAEVARAFGRQEMLGAVDMGT